MIVGTAEEACIAEVSCYNPSFPVTSCLSLLFQNFKEHPVIEGVLRKLV